jgi:hypothetical protein
VPFKGPGAEGKPEITATGEVRVVRACPPVDEAGAVEVVLEGVEEVVVAEVAVSNFHVMRPSLGPPLIVNCERSPRAITQGYPDKGGRR